MKKILSALLVIVMFSLGSSSYAASFTPTLRGGLGMDINGGLAFGLSGNYLIKMGPETSEIGLSLYSGNSSRSTTSGVHTYNYKTSLYVLGLVVNLLPNYNATTGGMFGVLGVGMAGVLVNWSQQSNTDSSLGTPDGAGGSEEKISAGAAASIVNLGVGWLAGDLDVRFEVPMLFIFNTVGGASSFVPTFTLTAGYRL